jgi:hypothetical protein
MLVSGLAHAVTINFQFLGSTASFQVQGNECLAMTLTSMVGAGRFERPTPCAQGRSMVSKGSIRCGPFFMFTTTWGICFSLRSKPKAVKGIGFDTVLTQSG